MVLAIIIVLIIGFLLLVAPTLIWYMQGTWKTDKNSKPPVFYIWITRVGFGLLTIGFLIWIYYLMQ